MKPFRFLLTLRGLIFLVALVAVCLAIPLQVRRMHYLHMAGYFRQEATSNTYETRLDFYPEGAAWEAQYAAWKVSWGEYSRVMQKRYEYAASRPWVRDPMRWTSIDKSDSAPLAFRDVPYPGSPPPPPPVP